MERQLNDIICEAKKDIANVTSGINLAGIKVKFCGKNGKLTALLKSMKDIPVDKRPQFGKLVNSARTDIESLIAAKEEEIKQQEKIQKMSDERIDITIPGTKHKTGTLHPLNIIKNKIISIFTAMGFTVADGREIETDYYNFQALNMPPDHPARDAQDTFYITDNILLRTHTSPAQVHVMENTVPPIRILSTGKVFRIDDDATHTPMFHQIEGLAIEQNITLCDLKGVLSEFAKQLFDKDTKTRLRSSYFPFTEPSVEVDVSCAICKGGGCKLCKGTGWLEILGAGMVNRKVLQNCQIDPDKYRGFAFGMGIERIAMIKYGIPDIRLLFENDIRFLKQFKSTKI